jgi:hypothetical protein
LRVETPVLPEAAESRAPPGVAAHPAARSTTRAGNVVRKRFEITMVVHLLQEAERAARPAPASTGNTETLAVILQVLTLVR